MRAHVTRGLRKAPCSERQAAFGPGDLGYVPSNVIVMSYLANRLKNDGTAAQHARIAQWMTAIAMKHVPAVSTAGMSAGLL